MRPSVSKDVVAPVRPQSVAERLRAFRFRVALPALLVYCGTVALVCIALVLMALQINATDSHRMRQAAQAVADSLVITLSRAVASEAHRDESYTYAVSRDDLQWVARIWGAAARFTDDYDTVLLLDSRGSILYGYGPGGELSGARAADVFEGGDALLAPLFGRSIAPAGAPAAGFRKSRWGVAAVAADLIRPRTFAPSPQVEDSRILLFARHLDGHLLARFGQQFQIRQPSISFEHVDTPDRLALRGPGGAGVADLLWQTERPGYLALFRTLPFAVAFLGFVGIGLFLVLIAFRTAVRRAAVGEIADWRKARHDDQTGLLNRFGFREAFERARSGCPPATPAAILHIDLDDYKEVVESYGHEIAQSLIKHFTRALKERLPQSVLAGRLGDDEFVLGTVGTGAEKQARAIADVVLAIVSELQAVDGRHLRIGASIGLATTSDYAVGHYELLRRASAAMHRVKSHSRNDVLVYDPGIDAERQRDLALETDMRKGLLNGEFRVVYQPVVECRTRETLGWEALLRWDRPPGLQPLSPGEFIPVAERSDIIDDLGLFVLRQALTDTLALGNRYVSVNVSAAQFRNPALVDSILGIVDEIGFPAHRLQLEITETYLVAHPKRAAQVIAALRRCGISVALDDFGAGYASIGYLREFGFDRIKLDQSYVRDIDKDPSQAALARAAISLAKALDLDVTAEGVETVAEAELLAGFGCFEHQGFLYARPVSIDATRGAAFV